MSVTVATRPAARRANTVTVDIGSPTGAVVNQRLLGCLHPFGVISGNATPALARAQAAGVVNVQRTDKMLSCSPWKLGGTDATRPFLGYSGLTSFDPQVIDRGLADAAAQGAQLYPSLDACPECLGGSVPPFSGANLATKLPGDASYPTEVPNDLEMFAVMCVDLIHYITVTQGVSVPYWGVWNEPDGAYWDGTAADYFEMYAEVAVAVKAFNPALKIGGPESVDPLHNYTAWHHDFLAYCKANAVPLDFLAIHDYHATGWVLNGFFGKLERSKASLDYTDPFEVICGEWNGLHGQNNPGAFPPFGTAGENLTIDDNAAAFMARQLMEMQRLEIVRAIFYTADSGADGTSASVSGLFANAGPNAIGNVYRLWAQMGDAAVLDTELVADPGMSAIGALADDNTVYVLLSNRHYRRDGDYRVTVELPGVSAGRATTLTVIDRDHSNYFDAGLANAELQSVPVADVAGGQVRITMQARSVCLLEIAP